LPASYKKKSGIARWTEFNRLERVDGPCWVSDDAKRAAMSPMAYYRKMIAKENGVAVEDVSDAEVYQCDTVANRIRWHFKVSNRARVPNAPLHVCHHSLVLHAGQPRHLCALSLVYRPPRRR
jgi:hypothetical protein